MCSWSPPRRRSSRQAKPTKPALPGQPTNGVSQASRPFFELLGDGAGPYKRAREPPNRLLDPSKATATIALLRPRGVIFPENSARAQGQQDAERRPASGPVLDPGLPAVERRELRHEGEADAGSGRRRAVSAHERLEDPLLLLVRDPGAGVVDAEQEPLVPARRRDPHSRAGRRVLQRIRDEVVDDPLDLARVDLGIEGSHADLDLTALGDLDGCHRPLDE